MDPTKVEHALEAVWMLQERGKTASVEQVAQFTGEPLGATEVAHLGEHGWIAGARTEDLQLTEQGSARARDVVRRHRLAERLMRDVLGLGRQEVEQAACRIEHILSSEATDSVCTLLGHPSVCPHGHSIPPGRCCETLSREVAPLVRPLSDLSPGQLGEIAFLAPSFHRRLDRLSSFGILPGSRLQLHQKTPTYVVRVGHTELALEADVAREIYLRGVRSPNSQPEDAPTDAHPVDRG